MDAISVVLSSFRAAKGQDLLRLQPGRLRAVSYRWHFSLFVLRCANVVPASLPALQTEANIQLY